jgi:hypothetical protein
VLSRKRETRRVTGALVVEYTGRNDVRAGALRAEITECAAENSVRRSAFRASGAAPPVAVA